MRRNPAQRKRVVALCAALIAGAWGGGCGLSVIDDPGADEQTGNNADAMTSSDRAASSSNDATSSGDTRSSDGGGGGALDAMDAKADTFPPTFCATLSPAPTFCADFDDPQDASANAGWNNAVSLGSGAEITLSSVTNKSAPQSLHATSTQGNAAFVLKTLPIASQISVELDVRYAALPGTGRISPLLLTPPVFPGADIYFFANATDCYFQEYGDDSTAHQTAPSLNKWHHISIAIAITSATSVINASVDGVAFWTNHLLLHAWPTPTTATLRIGVASLYQATNGDVFIDNVVVRTQ